jgi:hypothetical protein
MLVTYFILEKSQKERSFPVWSFTLETVDGSREHQERIVQWLLTRLKGQR